jgi:hypothetical protein
MNLIRNKGHAMLNLCREILGISLETKAMQCREILGHYSFIYSNCQGKIYNMDHLSFDPNVLILSVLYEIYHKNVDRTVGTFKFITNCMKYIPQ